MSHHVSNFESGHGSVAAGIRFVGCVGSGRGMCCSWYEYLDVWHDGSSVRAMYSFRVVV